MQIIIRATDEQYAILVSKFNGNHLIQRYYTSTEPIPNADLYIDACFEEEGPCFKLIKDKPVLVNAVSIISAEMPSNFVRFNGWGGFISQPTVEIAGNEQAVNQVKTLLSAAEINAVVSADEIGMLGPRVVSMIINEAFFALNEEVSTKDEIDTAMKLGTNYPYGPFEWSNLIGINNIAYLLKKLAETNERYTIAPALKLN
jgi:3-hydroxybutyryl-CoA dehydrogenase